MFYGITSSQKKENIRSARKKLSSASLFAIICIILPLIILAAFHYIEPKPNYGDIGSPVARVETRTGVGTAFLVSTDQLLTARHVVEKLNPGDTITVIFEQDKSNQVVKANLEWKAPTQYPITANNTAPLEYFLTDVALLKLHSPIEDITPLVLGLSEDVKNLDEVILIGYPRGDYSISEGNINSTSYQNQELFKLDATSNPGNSGGPCLSKKDNTVIGILVGGPSNPLVDGENLSIKIDDVVSLLGDSGLSIDD